MSRGLPRKTAYSCRRGIIPTRSDRLTAPFLAVTLSFIKRKQHRGMHQLQRVAERGGQAEPGFFRFKPQTVFQAVFFFLKTKKTKPPIFEPLGWPITLAGPGSESLERFRTADDDEHSPSQINNDILHLLRYSHVSIDPGKRRALKMTPKQNIFPLVSHLGICKFINLFLFFGDVLRAEAILTPKSFPSEK